MNELQLGFTNTETFLLAEPPEHTTITDELLVLMASRPEDIRPEYALTLCGTSFAGALPRTVGPSAKLTWSLDLEQ